MKSVYGVGCQIRKQAGHGAAHSLATSLEAAEFIPRLAAVNAGTLKKKFSVHRGESRNELRGLKVGG